MARLAVAVVLFALTTLASAQDLAKVSPNHAKVLKENSCVRVIENTLKPGEKDALHVHPAGWYYVTSPGTLKEIFSGNKVEMWEAKAGEADWIDGEGPHTSENVGKTPVTYVLVEIKGACKAPPAAAPKPAPDKKK